MITARTPSNWLDLQQGVARILSECGFSVEIEKVVQTVRGNVEIDVFAQEIIDGRTYVVLCECKHWAARVPKNVVHGFRTAVGDSGANLGYIISRRNSSLVRFTAAELSNIRLVTWEEFQSEFEPTWLKKHLIPTIRTRLTFPFLFLKPEPPAPLMYFDLLTYTSFLKLSERHRRFAQLMFILFSETALREYDAPTLPLRSMSTECFLGAAIPDAIWDATGYAEFLEAAMLHAEAITADVREVVGDKFGLLERAMRTLPMAAEGWT